MMGEGRVRRALSGDRSIMVTRAVPLDDIKVLSRAQGGDGRTVEAYAAVFNTPAEIVDQDGHYFEQNHPASFDKSINERQNQIFCVYNHARSLGGQPSDLWSVPIGKPVGMRTDKRGWLTVTQYSKDPESERILEAIRSGALTGMSYTGVFLRSDPELASPFDSYGRSGEPPLVTRLETAVIEYGPTPIPAYDSAQIVAVRSGRVAMTPQAGQVNVPPVAAGGQTGPQAYEQDPEDTVTCPNCGLMDDPDASYCDQCGEELSPSMAYSADEDEIVQCPSCGLMNETDAIFCDQCGRALPQQAYITSMANDTSSSGRMPWDLRERAAQQSERLLSRAMASGNAEMLRLMLRALEGKPVDG